MLKIMNKRNLHYISFFILITTLIMSLSSCTSSKVNDLTLEIKEQVISVLQDANITDFTIGDKAIEKGYNDYHISVDIPELENMDDEEKLKLIFRLCDLSDGFFPGKATSTSEFVHINVNVTSNGNRYFASDRYTYYMNDEPVRVNEYPESNGNYDKNDKYYSDNDYNNDSYIDGNEFQGAVDDWMDDHGY